MQYWPSYYDFPHIFNLSETNSRNIIAICLRCDASIYLEFFFLIGGIEKFSEHKNACVLQNHRTVLQSTVISQGFDGILHKKKLIPEEAFLHEIESICIKTELNSLL